MSGAPRPVAGTGLEGKAVSAPSVPPGTQFWPVIIDRDMLIISKRGARYLVKCFGRKSHFRKDGSCKHTDAVIARLKPWYRARTSVDTTP